MFGENELIVSFVPGPGSTYMAGFLKYPKLGYGQSVFFSAWTVWAC